MRVKKPATFTRRMVRANARRQALSNLSGQTSPSLPHGIEIEIRIDGVAVVLEPFRRRVAAGRADPRNAASRSRNAVALLDEEEPCRNLGMEERRQSVVALVSGEPGARSAQEAIGLKLLAGRVIGRADADSWRLRFEPSWPAGLASRRRDLYSVMLSPTGQILVFEERQGRTADECEGLEVSLEGEGERVWGILAIDPETGKGWMRCLKFQVPRKK